MLERTGIVEELAANRAKYAWKRYVAPEDRVGRTAAMPAVPKENPFDPPAVELPCAPVGRAPTIPEVQAAFCAAYHMAGGRSRGGAPYTVGDLNSPYRPHVVSHPRQVCMALVRQLCPSKSLPAIGQAFKKDHTTVMTAVKRAPHHLGNDPALATAYANVLAIFESRIAAGACLSPEGRSDTAAGACPQRAPVAVPNLECR